MQTWALVSYRMGVDAIERSYSASKRAFEGDLKDVNDRWKAHIDHTKRRTAEETEEEKYNDEGYGEHLAEIAAESEEQLSLAREAFCLILYHYWEKKAIRFFKGIKPYNQDRIFAAADADPDFEIDKIGLNRLRLITNCIKHDNGKKLFQDAPELFDRSYIHDTDSASGWGNALSLRDCDIEQAFKAVRSSSPRSNTLTRLGRGEEP